MEEAPALAALVERARRSSALLCHLQKRIPPGLRGLVRAGPLEENEWCLLVDNPAAATKMKHLVPLMLQDLQQLGEKVTGIRIKIQARGR